MSSVSPSPRARRSFAHVERPVGVREIRYRSRMEANYAAYLDWLLSLEMIAAWDYEPRTFWFTPDAVERGGVRRGVTSCKLDFRVSRNAKVKVLEEWHEVKGYMDDRSRVALARMKHYYPNVKIVLIDSTFMAALKRQGVPTIAPGWIH